MFLYFCIFASLLFIHFVFFCFLRIVLWPFQFSIFSFLQCFFLTLTYLLSFHILTFSPSLSPLLSRFLWSFYCVTSFLFSFFPCSLFTSFFFCHYNHLLVNPFNFLLYAFLPYNFFHSVYFISFLFSSFLILFFLLSDFFLFVILSPPSDFLSYLYFYSFFLISFHLYTSIHSICLFIFLKI